MEAVARARFVRMSASKVRRVAELVRGKVVNEAIEILNFVPKAAALPLQKSIKSAASNILAEEGTTKIHPEDLKVKTLFIDGGPIWKRVRAVGMGRAYRIRKRTCHITVVVEGEPRAETAKVASSAKAKVSKAEPITDEIHKKAVKKGKKAEG